jgi:hypothetical protein
MAWERERRRDGHGTTTCGRGGSQPARRMRKGGRGKGVRRLVVRLSLLGQMATGPEERKGKNRNLFQNWFLALEK